MSLEKHLPPFVGQRVEKNRKRQMGCGEEGAAVLISPCRPVLQGGFISNPGSEVISGSGRDAHWDLGIVLTNGWWVGNQL